MDTTGVRNERHEMATRTDRLGRSRNQTRKEVSTMLKVTIRYARYALSALASVAFALSAN